MVLTLASYNNKFSANFKLRFRSNYVDDDQSVTHINVFTFRFPNLNRILIDVVYGVNKE